MPAKDLSVEPDEGIPNEREIRASFDDATITVYQAYSPDIARPAALRAGTFVPPFKRDRMTWIKPSFLWMMHRSGWGTKPGQDLVLAVRMTRAGFEEALSRATLSSFDPGTWKARLGATDVRVQWDPERAISLDSLPHRSIQVGLKGKAAAQYVDDWIIDVEDVSELAGTTHASGNEDTPLARRTCFRR
ncbi:hypothetical protein GCM10011519_15670 [Marmoricola endophyticus]|uniref:DUF4291 domain-containing protein n=1 Tax=Marmoricola endophyticus TaxID=2040280 RepID=A0A917F1C4_9ACTN|nr:DUF4291 domain-containing protein [Marmoricola endophyticus]GGF42652.1 hypothetical protein GCM10011519_15670 [Marmoricola endophyticus]